MAVLKRMHPYKWYQVDGDINVAGYGGTIARLEGDHIELLKIQPLLEYLGEREAVEVGHPYWTSEGCYTADDGHVNPFRPCPIGAGRHTKCGNCRDDCQIRGFIGIESSEWVELSPVQRACAYLDYGEGAYPGPSGFSVDVLPVQGGRASLINWFAKQGHSFRQYDAEFRRLIRECA